MQIDTQAIITAGAVLSVLSAFTALAWKLFHWIARQKEQDKELERIERKFDETIKQMKTEQSREQAGIMEEQTLIVYGLLACLKGLREQGCDGPVADAINKIEKHINQKAHDIV